MARGCYIIKVAAAVLIWRLCWYISLSLFCTWLKTSHSRSKPSLLEIHLQNTLVGSLKNPKTAKRRMKDFCSFIGHDLGCWMGSFQYESLQSQIPRLVRKDSFWKDLPILKESNLKGSNWRDLSWRDLSWRDLVWKDLESSLKGSISKGSVFKGIF